MLLSHQRMYSLDHMAFIPTVRAKALRSITGFGSICWLMCCLVFAPSVVIASTSLDTNYITSIDVLSVQQGFGQLRYDRSVDGNVLRIAQRQWSRGLGSHARSSIDIYVDRDVVSFDAFVGLDSETLPNAGQVRFFVLSGTDTVWSSPVMSTVDTALPCHVSLQSPTRLRLIALEQNSIAYTHVNWCDARIVRQRDTSKVIASADTLLIGCSDLLSKSQGFDSLHCDRSLSNSTLRVHSTSYARGLATHANSALALRIPVLAREFRCLVGLDDSSLPNRGSVEFIVVCDADTVWRSGILRTNNSALLCRVNIQNRHDLELIVHDAFDGTSYDHADWLMPLIIRDASRASHHDTVRISNEMIAYEHLLYEPVHIDRSFANTPLRIGGKEYQFGLGVHSWSTIGLRYTPHWTSFHADVGMDDNTLPKAGTAEFFVVADFQDTLWRSGVIRSGEAAKHCQVSLENVRQLHLCTNNGGDDFAYDHCNWVNPMLVYERIDSSELIKVPIECIPFVDLVYEQIPQYTPRLNRSYGKSRIQIGKTIYATGVGFHAISTIPLWLDQNAKRLRFFFGSDHSSLTHGFGIGSVECTVMGDGIELWRSGVKRTGDEAALCDIDVSTVHYLEFIIGDAGDGPAFDHASLANGYFEMKAHTAPRQYKATAAPFTIRTPLDNSEVHINGPSVVGTRPDCELLYRIPISGAEPIAIRIDELPVGLTLDTTQRCLRGSLQQKGSYTLRVQASNHVSTTQRDLRIVVSDTIARTPPMGWNPWMVHHVDIDEDNLYRQLRAYRSTRLCDYGYNYFNLDDAWQASRDADGNIQWDTQKFPHGLPAFIDSVHAYGLHFGLYTSPGIITCAEKPGSYGHEKQDVDTYIKWKVDAVKTDWCATSELLDTTKNKSLQMRALYKKMSDEMLTAPRNMLFMLDNYDVPATLEWGREIGAHTWRTGNDASDNWHNILLANGFKNSDYARHTGIGHWNDYDFLPFGHIYVTGPEHIVSRLSSAEQYTQMSLWCIGKSLLLLSFDLSEMSPFTFALVTNREVLAIHQDEHPTSGRRVHRSGIYQEAWANELIDGSMAVALFNRDNYATMPVTIPWSALGLHETQAVRVRDCWAQKDLGVFRGEFRAMIPRHDCMLLRLYADGGAVVKPDADTTVQLKVSPNPAQNSMIIDFELSHAMQVRFQLIDALGRTQSVSEETYYSRGSFQQHIQIPESCVSGLYVVALLSNNDAVYKKVVVLR